METRSQFSQDIYVIDDRIWYYNHLRRTTTGKYDNNGKGGYFRFDDDNKMGSVNHLNSNGPVQHMQPYICKQVIERTNPILDTLATWYTRQAFSVLNACE